MKKSVEKKIESPKNNTKFEKALKEAISQHGKALDNLAKYDRGLYKPSKVSRTK